MSIFVRLLSALLLLSSLAHADDTTVTAPPPATAPVTDCQQGVGLLLPLDSPAFAKAADMVRLGTSAWSAVHQDAPPFVVYATTGEVDDIVKRYGQAAASGCRVIIGPLTRNAVNALASQDVVRLPTIALNVPDTPARANPNLWFFGLPLEAEARQLAWQAFQDGRRNIVIVGTHNPVTSRAQQAFADEWQRLGGTITQQYETNRDPADLTALGHALSNSKADAVLLAAGQNSASLIRPYMGLTPVYTFSMAYTSNTSPRNNDLNGTRFLDMPWLLAPDNSEVQRYARLDPSPGMDMERLYALGIDAARLASLLLANGKLGGDAIAGVSGTLRPQPDGTVARELLPAQFLQGTVVRQDTACQ